MITFAIRPARPVEAAALTALAMRSKASHGYDAAFMEACRAELTIRETTLAERDVWVAEQPSGALAGFFGLCPPEGGVAEVDPIFVEPALQKGGVGWALWTKLEERARAMGAERIGLDADPHAVGFYERMGLAIVGRSPSGSIPGRFLPRMEKALG